MNQDENELTRQRREKLEALRRAGVDPFGGRYPVTHWARDLAERLGSAGESELKGCGPVSLAGRVVTMRHHGKTCFAHMRKSRVRNAMRFPIFKFAAACSRILSSLMRWPVDVPVSRLSRQPGSICRSSTVIRAMLPPRKRKWSERRRR